MVWSGVALQLNYWPQWTHVRLWAPTELTHGPLAPESYVITHHIISHYYVASDCWSTKSSEKCKQLYVTCGFQAVVCNTWNATDAQLATQSKNRNTQCMHAKNNACNRFAYVNRRQLSSCFMMDERLVRSTIDAGPKYNHQSVGGR